MSTRTTLADVRALLEQAAVFARGGDHTGAVARAKAAVRAAAGTDAHDEALLSLARFEAGERAWREAVEARRAAFLARERREARVPDPEQRTSAATAPPAEPSRPRWRRLRLRRRGDAPPAFA